MTVPYYGRRDPGALTAAIPGDTLVLPFAAYNDSGASIALTGLAVTDVEVIKNGQPTVRATDSGYSLISDTGMVGNRPGLYRVSIQLFNTADDSTFYASGSSYQAFIDAVTIDARTVKLWLGTWDIAYQNVNVSSLADTGVNDRLARILADTDTGIQGNVNVGSFADTGVNDRLARILADTDTGIQGGVNVTSLADTGINDRLAKIASDTDTGIQSSVTATNVTGFSDTGIQDRLARILADTDTGIQSSVTMTASSDTGINDRLAKILADTDTGIAAPDTGAILAAIMNMPVETGLKVVEALRGMSAVLLGKVSGGGTGTEVFRNAVADTKNRVTATVNAAGNRTAITYGLDT